jgi:hypothetical protein
LRRPAVTIASDLCKIHKPIDAGERHFSIPKNQKALDISRFRLWRSAGFVCNSHLRELLIRK